MITTSNTLLNIAKEWPNDLNRVEIYRWMSHLALKIEQLEKDTHK